MRGWRPTEAGQVIKYPWLIIFLLLCVSSFLFFSNWPASPLLYLWFRVLSLFAISTLALKLILPISKRYYQSQILLMMKKKKMSPVVTLKELVANTDLNKNQVSKGIRKAPPQSSSPPTPNHGCKWRYEELDYGSYRDLNYLCPGCVACCTSCRPTATQVSPRLKVWG